MREEPLPGLGNVGAGVCVGVISDSVTKSAPGDDELGSGRNERMMWFAEKMGRLNSVERSTIWIIHESAAFLLQSCKGGGVVISLYIWDL